MALTIPTHPDRAYPSTVRTTHTHHEATVMKYALLLAALFGATALAPAHAEPAAHHESRGSDDDDDGSGAEDGEGFARVAEKLGLSDDQRAKLRDSVHKAKIARVDMKARADRARLELRHALGQLSPDAKAVTRAVDALNAAEAELRKNHVELVLAIRGVLTDAQWKQVLELRAAGKGEKREQRREMMEERREERRERRNGRDD